MVSVKLCNDTIRVVMTKKVLMIGIYLFYSVQFSIQPRIRVLLLSSLYTE